MPLQIEHLNILDTQCDVIVDPTDGSFSGSGGTDYAIHTAAGEQLDAFCASLAPLHPGEVVQTGGFALPCKYIIHTVGPVWRNGDHNETVLLRSCYLNALLLAAQLGAGSIAFPLISAGTFGFPKDKVLSIATKAIADFFLSGGPDLNVVLCVFDKQSYELIQEPELEAFLRMNTGLCRSVSSSRAIPAHDAPAKDACCIHNAQTIDASSELDAWLKKHDDNFAVTLLKLIDKKGITDVQCYKRANVSRKTFSKINNDPHYRPSKPTVIAFAIALELTLDETESLLKTVGFSLSHSDKFDLIVEFFISCGIYDIYTINAALYKYDQTCLGC